jgi:hypothetical protein
MPPAVVNKIDFKNIVMPTLVVWGEAKLGIADVEIRWT